MIRKRSSPRRLLGGGVSGLTPLRLDEWCVWFVGGAALRGRATRKPDDGRKHGVTLSTPAGQSVLSCTDDQQNIKSHVDSAAEIFAPSVVCLSRALTSDLQPDLSWSWFHFLTSFTTDQDAVLMSGDGLSHWTSNATSPDSFKKSANLRSCWVLRNLTNFVKRLQQILNHWSLLVNSALTVTHEADYHPQYHQTPWTNQLILAYCWVLLNFINILKLYFWQILNHWCLFVNSANVLDELLSSLCKTNIFIQVLELLSLQNREWKGVEPFTVFLHVVCVNFAPALWMIYLWLWVKVKRLWVELLVLVEFNQMVTGHVCDEGSEGHWLVFSVNVGRRSEEK